MLSYCFSIDRTVSYCLNVKKYLNVYSIITRLTCAQFKYRYNLFTYSCYILIYYAFAASSSKYYYCMFLLLYICCDYAVLPTSSGTSRKFGKNTVELFSFCFIGLFMISLFNNRYIHFRTLPLKLN